MTFEPVHPEFVSTVCGDRVVSLTWSAAVEESLAARVARVKALYPGQPVPDSLKFGGYRVWRAESRDTSRMMLMREFLRADSVSWTFRGGDRQFTDPDSLCEIRLVWTRVGYDSQFVRMRVPLDVPGPYNGMGYFYAVTYLDSMGTQRSAKLDCYTELPVHSVAPQNKSIERVWVVPNPYHGDAPWDLSEGRRIQFVNLPAQCTVSIYTVAGDLVREIPHPDPTYFNYGNYGGALSWNLKNQDGEVVAPGVYVFMVEGPDGESYKGHFVIIY
ncbi:MAG: hypothetical protein JW952_07755 [Candidatus Eisenbacteria bacterium]|nr:hypothetical protein [Candidatus Eisenbacteria bacterium]